MKKVLFLILTLFAIQTIKGQTNFNSSLFNFQSGLSPKREVRAVWLTTIGGLDWPHSYAQSPTSITKQKKELQVILDQLKVAGINTVLFQTRIRGTVVYSSDYEPWDGCLSGTPNKSPGYDALGFAIEECHKRGMEIQAWIVTIPMGKWNQEGCKNLRNRYPSLLKRIGEEGFMDMENPQTAQYLANICGEITSKYDIDGIHLDYIRYPETWHIKVPKETGRNHITNIVKAISSKVYGLKPWVKMSCSPIGKFNDLSRYWSHGWNAYHKVCQDAQLWLKDNLMDELYPMMYFKGNQFYPFAIDWSENNYGKTIAPGLGIYFMDPKEKNWSLETITQELNVLRQYHLGNAYFRSKFFTDNLKGLYFFVANNYNRYPALIPAITWRHSIAPTAPQAINIDKVNGRISWSGAKDNSDAPYLLYNIYADSKFPVDINNPGNLVQTRLKEESATIPKNDKLFYAITAMDRYGNESNAIQEKKYSVYTSKAPLLWLKTNDNSILLSQDIQYTSSFVAIETLQGTPLYTRSIKDNQVNIKGIPQGEYVLKTINKHNQGSLIGYFRITQ
jgi:yngK protein